MSLVFMKSYLKMSANIPKISFTAKAFLNKNLTN